MQNVKLGIFNFTFCILHFTLAPFAPLLPLRLCVKLS